MRIIFYAAAVGSLVLGAASAQSKTLSCDDGPSFTTREFTINRDGAIGFNGTFIHLTSGGTWSSADGGPRTLADITGRVSDADLSLVDIVLPIYPREACTPADTALGTEFKCVKDGLSINVVGKGYRTSVESPVIAEQVTLGARIQANVTVDFKVLPGTSADDQRYLLSGQITEVQTGHTIHFEVPVNSVNEHCQVLQP